MTNASTTRTDEQDQREDEKVATLEKDVVFEILKNPRRRRVVGHIHEYGETDLGDLAEAIAADENETTVEALSADERKRVYIGLYQTHLPKMDDAGVVAYDQDRGVVAAGPTIDQLTPYLDAEDETDTGSSVPRVDLSGLQEPVAVPAVGLFASLLVVGLLAVAGTALPGPAWAVVLVVAAVAATWGVRWA